MRTAAIDAMLPSSMAVFGVQAQGDLQQHSICYANKGDEFISGAGASGIARPFDLGKEMRWIPADESQMESRGFYIPYNPVNNRELRDWLKAVRRDDMRRLSHGINLDEQAAIAVTYHEAAEYSEWLGKKMSKRMRHAIIGRLPTREEWIKAAKGPPGDKYSVLRDEIVKRDAVTRSVGPIIGYVNGYDVAIYQFLWEWASTPSEGESFDILGATFILHAPLFIRGDCRADKRMGVRRNQLFVGFRPILVPQDTA